MTNKKPLEPIIIHVECMPSLATVFSPTVTMAEILPQPKEQTEAVKKVPKFKIAGHLVDQRLKSDYSANRQLSIFDSLREDTKGDIVEVGEIDTREVITGIDLTVSEHKVVDSLCKLLHEKSQTLDPKKDGYYTGNAGHEIEHYGASLAQAPRLAFTLYELTKEYLGDEAVSGKDEENVKKVLEGLDKKHFLLRYTETIKRKDGTRVENQIEEYRKLIRVIQLTKTEFNNKGAEISKKRDTIVALNPIFTRQIDSKFILYPYDINKRTMIAYGSAKLSKPAILLREYLAREFSSKHYKTEIYQDALYRLLAKEFMKNSKRKRVQKITEKAIDTVKNLGLLLGYEIIPGASGEPKVIFNLNKDWE